MPRSSRFGLRRVCSAAPFPAFVAALAAAVFVGGLLVGYKQFFPTLTLLDAYNAVQSVINPDALYEEVRQFSRFADIPPGEAAAKRIEIRNGGVLTDPVLISGGPWTFADLCPATGCLAARYGVDGQPAHAYPLRISELDAAVIAEEPRQLPLGFSHDKHVTVYGLEQYRNGDLLAVFHYDVASPFGGGIARINPEGHPLWRRRDYSHHWPNIIDKEREVALVPSLRRIEDLELFEDWLPQPNLRRTVERCNNGQGPWADIVNVLDGQGRVIEVAPVFDLLLESPWASTALHHTVNLCDPTHLNFAHQLGPDAGGAEGIAPGDIVVSLRNISAFGILDGNDRRLKRLVRGEFTMQHAVRHLSGAKFLMLDNRGAGKASRLLMVDLASGEETTIFPNARAPDDLRELYTKNRGHLDVSADRSRAIISLFHEDVAVEVRLSDGEVLATFRSLHDVSGFERFGEERTEKAALFRMMGVYYAPNTDEE